MPAIIDSAIYNDNNTGFTRLPSFLRSEDGFCFRETRVCKLAI